jgi:hypothetical protein
MFDSKLHIYFFLNQFVLAREIVLTSTGSTQIFIELGNFSNAALQTSQIIVIFF